MNENMHKLLILLGAIAVVLLLVILLFTKNSPFMKFMQNFLSDGDKSKASHSQPVKKNKNRPPQRKSNEPYIEMATLIKKCDDRLRIIESSGQVRLVDEYYELIFHTRKGNNLKIQCSREAYERIPFNQLGSLTYKNNKLIRFKFYDGVVNN